MRNLTSTNTSATSSNAIVRFLRALMQSILNLFQSNDGKYQTETEDPMTDRPKVAQVTVVVSTGGPDEEEVGSQSSTITLTVNETLTSWPYSTALQFSGNPTSYPLTGTPSLSSGLNQTTITYTLLGTPLSGESKATTTNVYLDGTLDPDNTGVPFSYS